MRLSTFPKIFNLKLKADMAKNAIRVKRELRLWIFLFLISVVVAVAISVVLESVVSPGFGEQGGWEINFMEMVRALIYELSFRVLGIFLLLAGVRFIFLTVSRPTTQDFTVKR